LLPEIGIRMALGATRTDVLRMVLGSGLRLLGAGIAVGVLASLAATRVLSRQLFGVAPYDVPTLVSVWWWSPVSRPATSPPGAPCA
jgi:putative ABC transport system permease protein